MLRKKNVWYAETWDDDDLYFAIQDIGAAATKENIAALKVACMDLFTVADRQELICAAARKLFGGDGKSAKPKTETPQELCVKTPAGPIKARIVQEGEQLGIELSYADQAGKKSKATMAYSSPRKIVGLHVGAPDSGTMEKIQVKTPKGTIEARLIPDREYPGIELCYAEPGTGEPGAVMEYTPTHDDVVMRVYDVPHADDDPRMIVSMTQDKEYMS